MKDINFINTPSTSQQRELRIWFLLVTLLVGSLILISAGFTAFQLYLLHQLKSEKLIIQKKVTALKPLQEKHQNGMQEQQKLQKQLEKIHKITKTPKNPIHLITTVNQECNDSIQLQSLSIDKKQIELTAQCNNPENAIQFVQKLSHNDHFNTLQLISIQQNQPDVVLFAAKGTIRII